MGEEYFTPKEVAQKLKVSCSLIYKYAEWKRIDCFRVGTSIRFRQEDIDKFVKANQSIQKQD